MSEGRFDRRAFIWGTFASSTMTWSVLESGVAWLRGCAPDDPRIDALRAIVQHAVVPDARDALSASKAFTSAAAKLTTSDGGAPITEARAAWQRALLAWSRVFAFRQGPFAKTGALQRSIAWPVRSSSVAELIVGTREIDATLIDELGADMKGLFAIEALLFGSPPGDTTESWLHSDDRPRVLAFIREAARSVEGYATRAANQLGDGASFSDELAKNAQTSLSLLVNQMIETAEIAASNRIDIARNAEAAGALAETEIQARPSGLSSAILRTWIEAIARQYMHLRPLAQSASPDAALWTQAAFDKALIALRSLDAPLEFLAATQRHKLDAASRATRALEVTLKSNLATALGVTVTFLSGDVD